MRFAWLDFVGHRTHHMCSPKTELEHAFKTLEHVYMLRHKFGFSLNFLKLVFFLFPYVSYVITISGFQKEVLNENSVQFSQNNENILNEYKLNYK